MKELETTVKIKLDSITPGADWYYEIEGATDGVPYDMRLYQWECHLKTETGVKSPVFLLPEIVVTENSIQLRLHDDVTETLDEGVLFFNLLRTTSKAGWPNGFTEAIAEGTVTIKPGVTDHA